MELVVAHDDDRENFSTSAVLGEWLHQKDHIRLEKWLGQFFLFLHDRPACLRLGYLSYLHMSLTLCDVFLFATWQSFLHEHIPILAH